uniref:Uncharacterized protein n=1 Tax=Polyblepharides amylifera TaxID=1486889 RepID=A0A7R9XLZ5_9CHLO|mmetsp:Transcript_1269/g.1811  ORF Transcript_1269/g.1811 Transcript_1269/m.1811 type:complete len:289 (+) Transcript_1269:97-963(+)|eukprot:CAMPEP_0196578822 /NCGR_PEP_ID=MMETSP1081-20130531/9168_1 /TAXON_ID=36882 /ORGANISM="Pyramimonas amylifera, Strain CCMP720" /LENGTH=288 /DNA_ID=CAMNT_0041898155 /DNA_START=97 /DNA_END=963 /DNA_ORIENTATION=+
MRHLKIFICSLFMLVSNVNAGARTTAANLRSAYLALELIDMRCPSQFITSLAKEMSSIKLGTDSHRNIHTGRKLLGKRRFVPPPHQVTLKEFRETTRASAVEMAHKFCTGAPDDRGPAVFFPLHLDVDADNSAPMPDPTAGAATPAAVVSPVVTNGVVPPEEGAAAITSQPETAKLAADASPNEAPIEDEPASEGGAEDKKEKKKKSEDKEEDKSEEDYAPTQAVQNGPSMVIVMVLLVIVGVGLGIVGYKFVSKVAPSAEKQAPVADRATNLKKQLGKMKAVLESQG